MVIKQKVEAKGFCIQKKKKKKKKKKGRSSSQRGYIFLARVEQIIIYIFSQSLV